METELAILITLFTIQLGPLKVIGPFLIATRNAEPALRREIAVRSTLVAIGVAGLRGYGLVP